MKQFLIYYNTIKLLIGLSRVSDVPIPHFFPLELLEIGKPLNSVPFLQ